MSALQELDVVHILTPVSGVSEVQEKAVSFPAGTQATIVHVSNRGYLVEIGWDTSDVSCDGLLVSLLPDQVKFISRLPESPPEAIQGGRS